MADSVGLDRRTGAVLTDIAHLRQSVTDILTTPIGSRVMRRDYGSQIPELVDQPMVETTLLRLYVAAAEALRRWEPRFDIQEIEFASASSSGRAELRLTGEYRPRGHVEPERVVIAVAFGGV